MSDQEQARMARLISDHLVALDDALLQRPKTCTLCGAPPTFFDIAEFENGRALAYRLCRTCHDQPQVLERLGKLLGERYAQRQIPGG